MDAAGILRVVTRRLSGNRREFHQIPYLGRTVLVPDGVIREPPDYDEAWFYALAQRASIIFDVGANEGQAALIALLCPNVKEAVLVEANPDALAVGAEILVRNHLSARARFVCAFASNVAGQTARLWTVSGGAAGSMYAGHAKTAAKAGASMEVPTLTLDGLIEGLGVRPDLVKIDVEGAEGLVLEGGRRCTKNGATLLVEMHSNPDLTMTANAAAVLHWCNEVGYAAWYLARAERLDTPDPIATRGRCHLLLQPADRPYPPCLVGIRQQAPLSS
jgi:FkbM family methyltransferase